MGSSMAHFLFIDESGQDRQESPCEVLAGIAIQDQDLWNLVQRIHQEEIVHFGMRYSANHRELKGKKLLKRKTFKHARQLPQMEQEERTSLARRCLENGFGANMREITALAQAKIKYVGSVLDACSSFRCKAFASIVPKIAPRPLSNEYLRKDYAYLFQRFFYFLEDINFRERGIVVFDELERSECHILVDQMDRYFKQTINGRFRASQIIPEPFFVHSDLTLGVQIADLIAYISSWAIRIGDLHVPIRGELADLAQKVRNLQYLATRDLCGNPNFNVWSFVTIKDLRPVHEREDEPE